VKVVMVHKHFIILLLSPNQKARLEDIGDTAIAHPRVCTSTVI